MGSKRVFYAAFIVLLMGASTLYVAALARGPDSVLTLTQEAQSSITPETLERSLRYPINWPHWVKNLTAATLLNGSGLVLPQKDQQIEQGSIIRLSLVRGFRGKTAYQLSFLVAEYAPGSRLRLALLPQSDPSILGLFKGFEWLLEFTTTPEAARIRATIRVHTDHWRSRVFGVLAKELFLNRFLLPDPQKLAQLAKPTSSNPLPGAMQ